MSVQNKIEFPDPLTTETLEGVILVGGKLSTDNLITAYKLGIFPWPHEGYPLLWFCPDQRGILEFKDLHIGKSLQKWIEKNSDQIEVTVNQAFADVIKSCRLQKRSGQKGSWINTQIEKNYQLLQQKGHALSLECWENGKLISGIYGVQSETYFSCESMFFHRPNASKYAFIKLVEHLSGQGHRWMDLQMVTEVSEAFGAKYISKKQFLKKILKQIK